MNVVSMFQVRFDLSFSSKIISLNDFDFPAVCINQDNVMHLGHMVTLGINPYDHSQFHTSWGNNIVSCLWDREGLLIFTCTLFRESEALGTFQGSCPALHRWWPARGKQKIKLILKQEFKEDINIRSNSPITYCEVNI